MIALRPAAHGPSGATRAVSGTLADIAVLDSSLMRLVSAAHHGDASAVRRDLAEARAAYKRAEWLIQQYTPLTARALNGEPQDEPDEEQPRLIVHPTGMQVMATMLGGCEDNNAKAPSLEVLDSIAEFARMARVHIRHVHDQLSDAAITDAQIFDAARVELARLSTLAIAGVDAPAGCGAMRETAEALRGIRNGVRGYAAGSKDARLFDLLASRAARYLDANATFASFDRFDFIVSFANPLAEQLGSLRQVLAIPILTDRRPFVASVNSVFEHGAFEPLAYSAPGTPQSNGRLVALGERLFSDTSLSNGHGRSCASCHQRALGFTDGVRLPALLPAHTAEVTTPVRNTPTLINAALQPVAFADGRVAFLEDQVAAVVANPREMGGNAATLSRKTRIALAAYVRSLTRLESRFDRAVRGETSLISPEERRGFNLFMGRARCGTCHFAPLFNGTRPPAFEETTIEVIGVPAVHGGLDGDVGVFGVSRAPMQQHAFRVPTVRNAAVTAPYMHNGAFRTLEEVIDFYDAGGGKGRGLAVPNQTLPSDSLHLSRQEKHDLVEFMKALTDTTPAHTRR